MTIALSIIFSRATLVGNCEQFGPVGGNRGGHLVTYPSVSISSAPSDESGMVAEISASVSTSLALWMLLKSMHHAARP
jgi:hypothetical protein